MTIDPVFPRRVLLVLAGVALCAAYPLARSGDTEVIVAVVAGGALSTLNVAAGFLLIEYSFGKSYTVFLKAVLGGMGIRLAVMLAAMLLLIRIGAVATVPFVVSLLGFYAIYLVLEILYLQKKVDRKNQG
jgi:hypothetical protein